MSFAFAFFAFDAEFPAEDETAEGVIFGPNGNDYTGTATFGSGDCGDAKESKQDDILAAIAAISSGGSDSGDGSVAVDHNYNDALAYKTAAGVGIDGATVRAYLAADYNNDRRADLYVKGRSRTNTLGEWVSPMFLDPAEYVFVYFLQGHYGPDIKSITVE